MLIPSGCFVITATCAEPTVGETYNVGLAKIDVTPQIPIRLSGFWNRHDETTDIRQHLFARAMAIQSDGKPAVLVTVDSIGIPAALREEVARRLQAKRGLPPERLAIGSTHSHTSPAVSGVLPTMYAEPVPPAHQEHIDQYTRFLVDRVEEVAGRALDDLKPATLSFGIGEATFAANRRTKGGPVDQDLPLLCVKGADGKIRALYVSYACHCVVFRDFKISGDWAGYAAERLEHEHPGAIALVSIGCGADANPQGGVNNCEPSARHYAGEIAAEVERLLSVRLNEVTGDLGCQLTSIPLPLMPLKTREQWQEEAKQGGIDGYYASYQLARLDRGEKLATEVPYPIQTWKFGKSLAVVFLGGEVVVDYSLRLKREFDASRLWINAYTNAAPAYIPSERVLAEGGYEAGLAMHFYGLPAWFAPGLEEKIFSTIAAQLGDAFEAKPTSAQIELPEAKGPRDSLATMKVAKGFRIELMASEPAVRSPVAIDFGPDGKLWVAQMIDYGCQADEHCPPMGRISTLEDRDGDGSYETATVFLDEIACPMSVSVWRRGVLICAAPDVLYAEDTSGDGKADVVRKLLAGFGVEHPQARVNGFAAGLDGWQYAACAFGGELKNLVRKDDFKLPDGDFRLKADQGTIEPETGRTQQSRVRDDWGNWFGCNNSELCWHYPLAYRYVARNPLLAPPPLSASIASPEAAKLYPPDNLVLFALSGPPGKATAACGIGVYRDEVLGPEFTNNVFTCEAVNQLVHRMRLRAKGATFIGERAASEADCEFLTSADNWFRPVQARTGPDGALWVVDMYRYVIEHPLWIPQQDLERLDIAAARAYGRIYRVLPTGVRGRPFTRLDTLRGRDLVAAMDSPNGWQRDMVQQLLTWEPDKATIEPLEELARTSTRPATRLQALCTLGILGELSDAALEQALADGHPAVRRHAIRWAEPLMSGSPAWVDRLLALCDDANGSVALQLACSLGEIEDSRTVAALAKIAARHTEDPYVLAAVLSSVHETQLGAFMREALSAASTDLPLTLLQQVVELAGASEEASTFHSAVELTLRQRSRSDHRQFAALAAFLRGLRRNKGPIDGLLGDAGDTLRKFCASACDAAKNAEADRLERLDAVQVLGQTRWPSAEQISVLSALLSPDVDQQLQNAAIESLSLQGQDRVADELLGRWPGLTPSLRASVLNVLLRRKPWVQALLAAIDQRKINASEIDAVHRYQIKRFPDEQVHEAALRHFAEDSPGERAALVDKFEQTVARLGPGDPAHGMEVFRKHCATCHKLKGIGSAVGPDLAAFKDKSSNSLLREILDPNRAVDQRFAEYVALTVDGQVKKGVLVEETGNSITLRGLQGEQATLLRSDLESLSTSGKSLMPEGLEREMTAKDLADVIAFVAAP